MICKVLILQILILMILILIIYDHFSHYNGLAYGIIPKSLYFGHNTNISQDNGTSEFPQIAASGKNVYVVWEDDINGNKEIYFTSSLDTGSTFGSITNLSENNGTSEFPQIAASGKNVYVVWEDDINGNKEIYFTSSLDTGSTIRIYHES